VYDPHSIAPVAQSIVEKAKALNPFGKIADVLVPPTPSTSAAPATPAKPFTAPEGPDTQVQWADPKTGKRAFGTPAERDLATKKPAAKPIEKAKSPAAPRSMAKGGR
jgi:hypothetical protein